MVDGGGDEDSSNAGVSSVGDDGGVVDAGRGGSVTR